MRSAAPSTPPTARHGALPSDDCVVDPASTSGRPALRARSCSGASSASVDDVLYGLLRDFMLAFAAGRASVAWGHLVVHRLVFPSPSSCLPLEGTEPVRLLPAVVAQVVGPGRERLVAALARARRPRTGGARARRTGGRRASQNPAALRVRRSRGQQRLRGGRAEANDQRGATTVDSASTRGRQARISARSACRGCAAFRSAPT